ncbi:hypothetical protein H4R21_001122 [Coemansia helicoidea]|uniref:Uncharacterized protein n=1 Tax=Coemansia helicoidea TaxID=1286919 RepID=A0ACC1LE78_9FUNG|nr:hypothetical protein H4R21_001122 [Coemansia helicoidea]
MTSRQATHAGSWYSSDPDTLDRELQGWLGRVPSEVAEVVPPDGRCVVPVKGARAIIGPHAGLSYSGSNAAYGYRCIDADRVRRVFLLGPSHHVYLEKCALSLCDEYETPLGSIAIDRAMVAELQSKGDWQSMSAETDEDEHSLELHLPYIYKTFERRIDEVKLVPIMVGNLRFKAEQYYGELLAPYLADEQNLFVVSSDFCHWGSRFSYTIYKGGDGAAPETLRGASVRPAGIPIWESIQRLDYAGMAAIARLDHAAFERYLKDTRNTICGRHPIGVLLAAVNTLYPVGAQDSAGPALRFVKYDQSSKVHRPSDSSVSYASAYLQLPS